MPRLRRLWPLLVCASCGARSGLPGPDHTSDAGAPDATADAPPDVVTDAQPDVATDAPQDVAVEAPPDVMPPSSCEDAGTTYVYVITEQQLLYRFDPSSSTASGVGTLDCPSNTIPFSMAVDRQGTAYVLYRDGHLFRVSTATAKCEPTSFEPAQLGWKRFGMAFVASPGGDDETLFVAESSYQAPSLGLAKLDIQSLSLGFIAPFSGSLGNAVELSGTGEGRLFAFALPAAGTGSTLAEVDPVDATVSNKVAIPLGNFNSSFAFAHWGGDFYLFTSVGPSAPTTITRYQPSDGSLVAVAQLANTVVGVGVSTCAPQ